MSRNIRPGTLRAYAFGVITGSLITAAIAGATTARADISDATVDRYAAAVCATLDQYPTLDGIVGIGSALTDRGYSGTEAGEIIGGAVYNTCPEYVSLIKRFVAVYGRTANSKAA